MEGVMMKNDDKVESKGYGYNSTDYVSVGVIDDKGNRKSKFIRTNIFNDGNKRDGKLSSRLREYLIKKLVLMRPEHKRFNTIHKKLKQLFLYKGIKISGWLIRKFLVVEDKDIDSQPYNNFIRMFRYCWGESVKDIWRVYIYRQKKFKGKLNEGETPETIIKRVQDKNSRSYMARMLARDIFVTEMLEDTADREWCNYFCLRLTHLMMEHYGVSPKQRSKVPLPGEYPVYESQQSRHIDYFVKFINDKVWHKPGGNLRDEVKQDE
jgi:hypothetical protein